MWKITCQQFSKENSICYRLQPLLLKQEQDNEKIYEATWEIKKTNGCFTLKMTFYQLLLVMPDKRKVCKI